MRSVTTKTTTLSLILICSLALIGCGGVKPTLVVEEKPSLIATLDTIPVRRFDEQTKQALPYEASPNPYLLLKGRIKKDAVASYIQARRLVNAKKWAEAENVLATLVESDDSLSGPWVMRGDIASEQQDYKQAEAFYRQALIVNKDNVNAYLRLALAQRQQGRYLAAQNTLAKALLLWPDFPEAHLNIGIVYDVYLNMPLRAQKHMEAYQFLTNGENSKAAKWLAEVKSRTGIPTELLPESEQSNSASLQ